MQEKALWQDARAGFRGHHRRISQGVGPRTRYDLHSLTLFSHHEEPFEQMMTSTLLQHYRQAHHRQPPLLRDHGKRSVCIWLPRLRRPPPYNTSSATSPSSQDVMDNGVFRTGSGQTAIQYCHSDTCCRLPCVAWLYHGQFQEPQRNVLGSELSMGCSIAQEIRVSTDPSVSGSVLLGGPLVACALQLRSAFTKTSSLGHGQEHRAGKSSICIAQTRQLPLQSITSRGHDNPYQRGILSTDNVRCKPNQGEHELYH